MTAKTKQSTAKAKSRPTKSKLPATAGGPKPAKDKGGKGERLRPGELDGLVLSCLSEHKSDWPMTATAIRKIIGRSSGAIANSLRRLADAKPRRVRQATEKPRAYDLRGVTNVKSKPGSTGQ
jgi:hypothetical protein